MSIQQECVCAWHMLSALGCVCKPMCAYVCKEKYSSVVWNTQSNSCHWNFRFHSCLCSACVPRCSAPSFCGLVCPKGSVTVGWEPKKIRPWNGFTFDVIPVLPGSHTLYTLTVLGGCGLQSHRAGWAHSLPFLSFWDVCISSSLLHCYSTVIHCYSYTSLLASQSLMYLNQQASKITAKIVLPGIPLIISMYFTNHEWGCSSSLAEIIFAGKSTFESVKSYCCRAFANLSVTWSLSCLSAGIPPSAVSQRRSS